MSDRNSRVRAVQNPHFGGSNGNVPLPARVVVQEGDAPLLKQYNAQRVTHDKEDRITCKKCQQAVDLDTLDGRLVEYNPDTYTIHVCKT